jgi:hypothetical protein
MKNIIYSRLYKRSILSATLLGLLLLPTANGQVRSRTWGSMDEWLPMSEASVGTATRSLALNNSANYTYVTTGSIPSGKLQVVANGFITFGWADLGYSGGYMDLVVLGDSSLQGGYVVLQCTNGSPCYCVHIETVGGGGFIGRSAGIEIVPLHRYSFSLLFDEINGLAQLAIFDPSNNFKQVGSTVTQQQNKGSTFSSFRFGNAEAGTSSGTTTYFENLMLDWTHHIFPNAPKKRTRKTVASVN